MDGCGLGAYAAHLLADSPHVYGFDIEHDRVVVERNNVELILSAFDSIVVSVGTQSVDTLSVALRREGFDVYTVGDCRTPRHAIDAIREGFEAGLTI